MKGNGMETGFSAVLEAPRHQPERVAYTVHEAAAMLGVHYFSVYWLIQQGKLHVCRALPGKLLIPRSEILRLLNIE
jgi:excisionase family DNA binding protein